MSTLLEQAIIDAEALREAAIKNAEAAIVEKYSSEVKDAIASLLEQEEDTLDEQPEEESAVMDDVPYGVQEEADEPVMIRLDLEALERALDEDDAPAAEQSHEELAEDLDEEIEAAVGGEEELDEELEIDEGVLAALAEELKVDVGIPDQGLGGRSTPVARDFEGQEATLASLKDDELSEEHEAFAKAKEELDMYQEQLNKLKSRNKRLEETVLNLKEHLEETNLSNAKLLYTNRVLNSASLNERQKNKIVESISNADSVDEAKVIYETLQSAVGTSKTRNGPQSLREAVEKPSLTLPGRREARAQNPQFNRMRALAGIKGGNK